MFLERFKEVENFSIRKLPLGGSKIKQEIICEIDLKRTRTRDLIKLCTKTTMKHNP